MNSEIIVRTVDPRDNLKHAQRLELVIRADRHVIDRLYRWHLQQLARAGQVENIEALTTDGQRLDLSKDEFPEEPTERTDE